MGDDGSSGGISDFGDPSAFAGPDNSGMSPSMNSALANLSNPDMSFTDFADSGSLGNPGGLGMTGPSVNDGIGNLSDTNTDQNSFGKTLQSFMTNTAVGKALNALGIPSTALGPVNAAQAGAKGPGQAATSMGLAGLSMAAPALGLAVNGINALTGNSISNAINSAFSGVDNSSMNGQGVANQGAAVGSGAMGGGTGISDLIGGLMGMYMGNRSTNQYNSVLGSLNDMYSPNSPYAQQLRQQLERKDAAAGRRSQYGPREVQLQAALADRYAQTLSSPGYANMMNQRNNMQNQGLGQLFSFGQKSGLFNNIGNGINGMMQGGGLQSLLNNGYSSNWAMGPNAGPAPDVGGSWDGGDSGGLAFP